MRKIVVNYKDGFEISGRGIIAFLKHRELGLKNGTILLSEKTQQKWKIDSRVLCDHAVSVHKIFEIESVNYMRMSFKTQSKKDSSLNQIREEESNFIYQYFIKSLNHDTKPIIGEELIIEYFL